MSNTRAHVYVSGNVQGVFYRATTKEKAEEHGVNGWVKNLDDGRVEAVFEGPEEAVDAMIAWCHEGSPTATVESVDAVFQKPEGDTEFEIRR